jgi:hypothetical protein
VSPEEVVRMATDERRKADRMGGPDAQADLAEEKA